MFLPNEDKIHDGGHTKLRRNGVAQKDLLKCSAPWVILHSKYNIAAFSGIIVFSWLVISAPLPNTEYILLPACSLYLRMT